jgi:hypothetical protein
MSLSGSALRFDGSTEPFGLSSGRKLAEVSGLDSELDPRRRTDGSADSPEARTAKVSYNLQSKISN